ncbi:MAG: hypothetical protein IJW82_05415 [Clostridia bacterium]|nr:hypothetical protein [Clostridia bacterium]
MDFKENLVCDCIILKPRLSEFGNSLSYCDFDICGKTMLDWVRECVPVTNVTEVECDENFKNEVEVIQPFLKDGKYTVVLYANMPLVYSETIKSLINYTKLKDLTIAKSGEINIYRTDYIKTNVPISKDYQEIGEADRSQFLRCKDYDSYCKICAIMQSNIIEAHLKNGVKIENPSSVVIDANSSFGKNVFIKSNSVFKNTTIFDNVIVGENCILKYAVIEENVEIKPNNIIEKSKISKGCVMDYNNIINNSILGENVKCTNSKIDSSKIANNCIIKAFCVIMQTYLCENVTLENYVKILEKKIKEGAKIKPFSILE